MADSTSSVVWDTAAVPMTDVTAGTVDGTGEAADVVATEGGASSSSLMDAVRDTLGYDTVAVGFRSNLS